MAAPESAQGRYLYSGSEEQPDNDHDAQKLLASGSYLETKKEASNRMRGGGWNNGLAMDADFYQREVLWGLYQFLRFVLVFNERKIKKSSWLY